MANLPPDFDTQFIDAGEPAAGYKLYTYETGTTTPKTTYSDQAGAIPNTNPVTLDAEGRCSLWLGAGEYTFMLYTHAIGDGGALVKTWNDVASVNENADSLRDDLADATDPTKGPAIVGFDPTLNYVAATIGARLNQQVYVKDFPWLAKGDGVTDDTASIQAAIDWLASVGGGEVHTGPGTFRITDTLRDHDPLATTFGASIQLVGVGASEEATDKVTRIKTEGAIVGIHFNGNRSGGRNFIIEGDGGAFSAGAFGILSDASRAIWRNIVCKSHRDDGFKFRFGNCSQFEHITCLSNKGNGFNIDGTGYVTPGGVARPNDANAATFIGLDLRLNSLTGLRTGVNSSFSNFFYATTSQGNVGYGIDINGDYTHMYGVYVENNQTGVASPRTDIHFGATADFSYLHGVFSNYNGISNNIYVDDSTAKRNYIESTNDFAQLLNAETLQIGRKTAGLPGYLQITEGVTNYELTLENTAANETLEVKSAGVGVLTLKLQALYLEPANTTLTLLNSWVSAAGDGYKAPGYFMGADGFIGLRGAIKDGTGTVGTQVFQLPAGYRPSDKISVIGADSSSGVPIVLDIASNGIVTIRTAGATVISLDAIHFRAA